MEEYKDIISLKDAASLTGYTTDYLGYLIRNGKLSGKKMGRTWVTTKADIDAYLSKSHFHAMTKLFSYLFSIKVMFYLALVVIAVLVYVVYFNPFAKPKTQVESQPVQPQSVEIDSGLRL